MAVYPEGRTDARALPILVQRTAERIIRARGTSLVEVLRVRVARIEKQDKSGDERILAAARRTAGYHALAVHCDADARTSDRALKERYAPGLRLVEKRASAEGNFCEHLFPIIPVKMTESWMLADAEVLIEVIGTSASPQDLKLPRPSNVESVEDPKGKLGAVIRRAISTRRRRKKVKTGELFEPVARRIRLDRLEQVDSFARFKSDLTDVLIDLHMAE